MRHERCATLMAMDNDVSPALGRWRKRTDAPLLILAIGSVPLLLLELSRDELAYGDRIFLDVVNVVVLVAFATDYVVELFLATQKRRHIRHEWTSLMIVVAQSVALVPSLTGFGALRLARLGRAGRAAAVLARLIAVGGASAQEGRAIIRRDGVRFVFGLAGLTWICSATAFTLVEDVGRAGRVGSFFDALWWSSTTITTVGYGDIAPVTAAGRLVGVFTMVVGISTFAVVTAKIAEFLVRGEPQDTVNSDSGG